MQVWMGWRWLNPFNPDEAAYFEAKLNELHRAYPETRSCTFESARQHLMKLLDGPHCEPNKLTKSGRTDNNTKVSPEQLGSQDQSPIDLDDKNKMTSESVSTSTTETSSTSLAGSTTSQPSHEFMLVIFCCLCHLI
jgi:hypothetical protein